MISYFSKPKIATLDEATLTEAFDTIEGYEVVNMKPTSPSPQIFLIKNGEDNNLIVRMMTLSGDGDKLRTLKPNDKNVIIELMSINERGRHIVLQGGIGRDPMKTIVTIFDTVMANLNLQVIDSIMFRFQPRKMKGQDRAIQRILGRLAKTRGKGKFDILDEMENFTKKFSYVVLHKKRLDLEKLPGAKNIPDNYKTMDTKMGVVYVDDSTGKQVSKTEVIANAIANTVSEISDKEMVLKTKLSKKEVIKAQYQNPKVVLRPSQQKTFDEIDAKQIAKNPDVSKALHFNHIKDFAKYQTMDDFDASVHSETSLELLRNTRLPSQSKIEALKNEPKKYGHYNTSLFNAGLNLNDVIEVNEEINYLISQMTLPTIQDTLAKAASIVKPYENHGNEDEIAIAKTKIFDAVLKTIEVRMTEAYTDGHNNIPNDDEEKIESLAEYCNNYFREVNEYLVGNGEPTPTVLEIIENMDSIFDENYQRIPAKTKLYRAMSLKPIDVKTAFDSKIFYFRNYVSTSLQPIIFGGFFGDEVEPHINTTSNSTDDMEFGDVVTGNMERQMTVGMVISGGDKLNVVIPYQWTSFPHECEVILPRGTAIQFDRVVKSRDSGVNSAFAEVSIIDPSSLDESTEIFDGDALVETGEVVPLSKFSFKGHIDQKAKAEAEMFVADSMQFFADRFAKTQYALSSKFK